MKKSVLLFGALALVSANLYAKETLPTPVDEVVVEAEVIEVEPALRITNMGQYLEIDNTSGGANIGEGVHFGNQIGLAYDDTWTFDLLARKTWSASTDNYVENGVKQKKGVHSNGERVELQAMRNFDNFAVGAKWRGDENYDRFYVPMLYNLGAISGWATPAYTFYNTESGQDDTFYLKAEPIQINYGPVQFAYFFEGEKSTGKPTPGYEDHWFAHQARIRGTFYSNDVVTLGAEYRYQFASDYSERNAQNIETKYKNRKQVAILNASYNVTENLTIDGYYQYDFNRYHDFENKAPMDDNYYGEFYLGWNYKF